MRFVLRLWAIFAVTVKRILSQPGLALASLLGMVFAISLTMSLPLYASSVYSRAFLTSVGTLETESSRGRFPPFSFLFTYESAMLGNIQWPAVEPLNLLMQTQAEELLGLPLLANVQYFATDPLALFPASTAEFTNDRDPLIWASLAYLSAVDSRIQIVEGEPAAPAPPDGPVDVLINTDLANQLGLQVGEQYNLFARQQIVEGRRASVFIPLRIAGIYEAVDPNDPYWFIDPALLRDRLLIPRETLAGRINADLDQEIYTSYWYLLADGAGVSYDQATPLVHKIANLQRLAALALPKVNLAESPVESLYGFQRSANLLTLLLFAFNVPIFGLLLAFIIMTAAMTVDHQRNEIAVLRGRGAMVAQMVGMAAFESLLLGLAALMISLPVSAGLAALIARTRSFLDFSGSSDLALNWTRLTIYFGLGAIALTVLARLLPTFEAARSTIVNYKRERSRELRPPFWQRIWLDGILLVPAGYGIYLLQQQGSIALPGAAEQGDFFSNPLLLLVPSLAIFALALFFLRLLPIIMRAVTWLAGRTNSVGLLMAARHLGRSPGAYSLPLALLMLTLSLAAFTATLAGTLDTHLTDQVYYRMGGDVTFSDLGDNPEIAGMGVPTAASATETIQTPGWYFLPTTDYLSLPGVQAVTRVGRYPATVVLGNRTASGEFVGIDRHSAAQVAFWRGDFADQSLGALMNQLALDPDGILAPRSFLEEHLLQVGDVLVLKVITYGRDTEITFRVAGAFDYFPTYYPGESLAFIGNLDQLYQLAGAEFPHEVWLKSAPGADPELLNAIAFTQLGANSANWRAPQPVIESEQRRPERQGLFGVLSVGFGAAALLTVLGFLIYAFFSLRRRFVELGVLRAIGLSTRQMISFLGFELAFLILMGGLAGTGMGVWISNLFIPYLQVGQDAAAQVPPYVVNIAWAAVYRVYALFGLLFIIALTSLVVWLRQMKIFQAIKLGEAI